MENFYKKILFGTCKRLSLSIISVLQKEFLFKLSPLVNILTSCYQQKLRAIRTLHSWWQNRFLWRISYSLCTAQEAKNFCRLWFRWFWWWSRDGKFICCSCGGSRHFLYERIRTAKVQMQHSTSRRCRRHRHYKWKGGLSEQSGALQMWKLSPVSEMEGCQF